MIDMQKNSGLKGVFYGDEEVRLSSYCSAFFNLIAASMVASLHLL
jgi:hypothetical protein